MNRSFIVLQLAFNILVLVALVALAWRGKRAAERPARRGVRRGALDAPSPPAEAPEFLTHLVEQAERKELAAEAALRARFARFRQRAAG